MRDDLAKLEDDDSGVIRGNVMSELLSQWTNLPESRHHHKPDGQSLATALDAAKLGYHAQVISVFYGH